MDKIGIKRDFKWKKKENDPVVPKHQIVSHIHDNSPEKASIL